MKNIVNLTALYLIFPKNKKLPSSNNTTSLKTIFPREDSTYSQTTLLSIQDSKKTRNNSSTESINHSLRLRLTHAHLARYIAHL